MCFPRITQSHTHTPNCYENRRRPVLFLTYQSQLNLFVEKIVDNVISPKWFKKYEKKIKEKLKNWYLSNFQWTTKIIWKPLKFQNFMDYKMSWKIHIVHCGGFEQQHWYKHKQKCRNLWHFPQTIETKRLFKYLINEKFEGIFLCFFSVAKCIQSTHTHTTILYDQILSKTNMTGLLTISLVVEDKLTDHVFLFNLIELFVCVCYVLYQISCFSVADKSNFCVIWKGKIIKKERQIHIRKTEEALIGLDNKI